MKLVDKLKEYILLGSMPDIGENVRLIPFFKELAECEDVEYFPNSETYWPNIKYQGLTVMYKDWRTLYIQLPNGRHHYKMHVNENNFVSTFRDLIKQLENL